MAKVEKEKGKEEKGSGHYSSHFHSYQHFILYNIQYWRTYHLKLLLFRYFCLHKNK